MGLHRSARAAIDAAELIAYICGGSRPTAYVAGRLLLGPAQADDDVKKTALPDLKPEHQEKGHFAHALSSEYGRPAIRAAVLVYSRVAEYFEKGLEAAEVFPILAATQIARA